MQLTLLHLGVVFRRGVLDARDAMVANGTAVDEQWIDQLLQMPATTVRGRAVQIDKFETCVESAYSMVSALDVLCQLFDVLLSIVACKFHLSRCSEGG
jgi:hypothetical protein